MSSSISVDLLLRRAWLLFDVSFESVDVRLEGLFGDVLVRSELIVCAVLRNVGRCILLV